MAALAVIAVGADICVVVDRRRTRAAAPFAMGTLTTVGATFAIFATRSIAAIASPAVTALKAVTADGALVTVVTNISNSCPARGTVSALTLFLW